MNPKLYIAQRLCDLPTDFGVTLTFQANEGFSPSGSFSDRSVFLPCTKTNDAVFGQWDQVQINNPESTEYKAMFLEVDGLPVIIGTAGLQGAEYRRIATGVSGQRYRVSLHGNNSEWITRLGNKKMSELPLDDINHNLTYGQVNTWFGANYPTFNAGYFVAKTQDWSTYGGSPCADIKHCVLFVYVPTLLTRLFGALGLTYASNYFDLDEGKHLVLPILFPNRTPAEYGVAYLDIAAETTTTTTYATLGVPLLGIAFTSQTKTPPNAPNPYVTTVLWSGTTTSEYTAKFNGYYRFNLAVTLDLITNAGAFQMGFDAPSGADAFTIGPADNGTTFNFTRVFYMATGDVLHSVFNATTITSLSITSAKMEVFGEATFEEGLTIDLKYLLKDWKQADFLKGLSAVLNLQYETNVAQGVVTIEPANNWLHRFPPATSNIEQGFYRNTQVNSDKKWDVSQDTKDEFARIEATTAFTYKSDSNDQTVQALEEGKLSKLYESDYQRDASRFKVGIEERENPFFAATMHIIDTAIMPLTSPKVPLLPLFWKTDYNKEPSSLERMDDYEPRLLFFMGQRGVTEAKIRFYNGISVSEIEQPAAFMVNYNDTAGFDPCLSYCDQNINGNEIQGLARRFYLQDMARTRTGRTRSTFFTINAVDILGLTFRDKINLDGVRWLLKSINEYNPLKMQSTRVELLLDTPDTTDDSSAFENSPILGYVSELAE